MIQREFQELAIQSQELFWGAATCAVKQHGLGHAKPQQSHPKSERVDLRYS